MPVPSAADRDTIKTAMARFTMANDVLSDTREDELDDLKFMAGSPDNRWQWPDDVQTSRASNGSTINARPMLTINKLPQHVKQVTNDQKQNRPEGKVIPVDDRADPEVADIFNGIIRHIEYLSDADIAYDTANDNQVTFGEGYWRIQTDHCNEMSFEQDIKIGRIRNSFSVYMDPTIQDPCGSDAQWCLITEDMSTEEFETKYPKASPVTTILSHGVGDQGVSQWVNSKTVRVAEYYYFDNEEATLCLLFVPLPGPDGKPLGERTAIKGSKEYAAAIALGAQAVPNKNGQPQERATTLKRVKWCRTNGYEILEKRDWAGKWIPVIRVVGNEWEIDGELVISGLIRNAKDAQRMYNYWTSQEAEMLALAPKAPFIGYGGQFEGYEDKWKNANVQNYPYLEVNPDVADAAGNSLPLPQRAQPPLAQNGLLQAKMGAADDIKGTTGQYDASLGNDAREKSGRAIIARDKQSDTGTYHYLDNFTKAKRFTVRQLVDLIPKIYDTARIARMIGVEGEVEMIKIDPNQATAMHKVKDQRTGATIEKIVNLGVGTYDVMATTGPSYLTKRQEFVESFAQILQGNPELWKIAGDLFIKNMDFPGAQELSKRFAKTIPPELMDDAEDTPEVAMLKQQVQQGAQKMQQMGQVIEEMGRSVDVMKIEVQEKDSVTKQYDAITKRLKVIGDMEQGDKQLALDTLVSALKVDLPSERRQVN